MIKLSVVPIVKFDAIRTDSIWVWAIKSGVVISGGPFTAVIRINGNNMIIDGLSSQSRSDSTHCAYFLSAILLIKRSQRFGEDTLNLEVSWRWWLYFRGERLSEICWCSLRYEALGEIDTILFESLSSCTATPSLSPKSQETKETNHGQPRNRQTTN